MAVLLSQVYNTWLLLQFFCLFFLLARLCFHSLEAALRNIIVVLVKINVYLSMAGNVTLHGCLPQYVAWVWLVKWWQITCFSDFCSFPSHASSDPLSLPTLSLSSSTKLMGEFRRRNLTSRAKCPQLLGACTHGFPLAFLVGKPALVQSCLGRGTQVWLILGFRSRKPVCPQMKPCSLFTSPHQ